MKLYIGNLPYEFSEDELKEALAEFEPIVEIIYPVDRETGGHRGFAFMTLPDREAGEAAMEALDGRKIGGRSVRVNEAEDRRSRAPSRPEPLDDPMAIAPERRDTRPTDASGKKVRYKGI